MGGLEAVLKNVVAQGRGCFFVGGELSSASGGDCHALGTDTGLQQDFRQARLVQWALSSP